MIKLCLISDNISFTIETTETGITRLIEQLKDCLEWRSDRFDELGTHEFKTIQTINLKVLDQ